MYDNWAEVRHRLEQELASERQQPSFWQLLMGKARFFRPQRWGNDRLTGGQGADRFSGGDGTDSATDFTPSQGDTQDGVENQTVLAAGVEEPAITSQLFLPAVQN